MDIVRVADKLKAFRQDFPACDYALIQSFNEDEVGGVGRVIGWCNVVDLQTGKVLAQAQGTRAYARRCQALRARRTHATRTAP